MSTLIAASSLTFFQYAQPKNRSPSRFYGIRFGRKPKLSEYQIREALARRQSGECLADIGRSYGVSHSTISRL